MSGAEVGAPTARGPREALRAVAWYAEHADASPGPEPLPRALWAVGLTLRSARLVLSDRRLFRAALLPTALTVAGCLAVATWATLRAGPGEREAGSTLWAFTVSFVALASMPPTLLQPLWVRLALEARRAVGLPPGEDPHAGAGFVRTVTVETMKALRQAVVVSAGIFPLLVLVGLLPFGKTEAAVLGGLWAFYWIVIDAFELPIDVIPGPRHAAAPPWYGRLLRRLGAWKRPLRAFSAFGRLLDRLTGPWHQEVRFTERHAWESAGFGVAVGLVLAVPGLGLFFRAVAITAATALLGKLGEPGQAPEAPFSDLLAEAEAVSASSPPELPPPLPPPWPPRAP